MTADLAQFIRDRLNEDDQLARAAGGDFIETMDGEFRGEKYLVLRGDHPDRFTMPLPADLAAHIGRHDPARVLAEVDAKRRLVNLHHPVDPFDGSEEPGWLECSACGPNNDDEPIIAAPGAGEPEWHPCTTLRLLALPYADHADYREEWRP